MYHLLGAFDVQDIDIGRSSDNKMCINCYFITNSSAAGCLIHIYINNSSQPVNVLQSNKLTNQNMSEWTCTLLTSVSFDVSIFDIDRFGLTSTRAALTRSVPNYKLLPIVISYTSTSYYQTTASGKLYIYTVVLRISIYLYTTVSVADTIIPDSTTAILTTSNKITTTGKIN